MDGADASVVRAWDFSGAEEVQQGLDALRLQREAQCMQRRERGGRHAVRRALPRFPSMLLWMLMWTWTPMGLILWGLTRRTSLAAARVAQSPSMASSLAALQRMCTSTVSVWPSQGFGPRAASLWAIMG